MSETLDEWQEYPTLLIAGTVIKILKPPYNLERIKREAIKNKDCDAFTSNGQLLKNVKDIKQWVYNSKIVSYLSSERVKNRKEQKMESELEQETENVAILEKSEPQFNINSKILHYVYDTENFTMMPKKIRLAISHNINRHINWDLRLYTPETLSKFIEKEYPKYSETYQSLTKYRKKQFSELLLIYKYGGVVTDISVKLGDIINDIIQKKRVIVISNSQIFAISTLPHDEMIKGLLELYTDKLNKIMPKDVMLYAENYHEVTVIK